MKDRLLKRSLGETACPRGCSFKVEKCKDCAKAGPGIDGEETQMSPKSRSAKECSSPTSPSGVEDRLLKRAAACPHGRFSVAQCKDCAKPGPAPTSPNDVAFNLEQHRRLTTAGSSVSVGGMELKIRNLEAAAFTEIFTAVGMARAQKADAEANISIRDG
jgi:hypothetical protein